METKTSNLTAETVYVNHPTASYGIFCFNSAGDLFLNSDWGFYGYAWRAIGNQTFKEFLSGLNSEYVIMKFEINYRQTTGKSIPKTYRENLEILIKEFINNLKSN